SNYFLSPPISGLELTFGGTPVVAGQFGAYVPIGAERTASGYDLCWSLPGGDSYGVWGLDSNGNYTSNILSPTSGTNPALESLEPAFRQDLNGDGTIGVLSTIIESKDATDFAQIGSNYFLFAHGTTS